jgi:hypothetical protein
LIKIRSEKKNEVNEVSFVLTRFFPRCGKAATAAAATVPLRFYSFYSTFVYF